MAKKYKISEVKHIKLLRICYKDFDNKNYINILNDNL